MIDYQNPKLELVVKTLFGSLSESFLILIFDLPLLRLTSQSNKIPGTSEVLIPVSSSSFPPPAEWTSLCFEFVCYLSH